VFRTDVVVVTLVVFLLKKKKKRKKKDECISIKQRAIGFFLCRDDTPRC